MCMSTSNTEGEVCNDDAEGKMILGKVDTKTYFVCDGGAWREATTDEEQAGEACTAKTNGTFNFDSTRVCNNTRFRASHVCALNWVPVTTLIPMWNTAN